MSDTRWFPYNDKNILYESNDGIVVDLPYESHVNIMLYERDHPMRKSDGGYASLTDGGIWTSLSPRTLDDLITVLQYAKLKITERAERNNNNQET